MQTEPERAYERFEGGRYEFLLGPGVTCTMDVESVIGDHASGWWLVGSRYSLTGSHSADRERHGEIVYVQVSRIQTASEVEVA